MRSEAPRPKYRWIDPAGLDPSYQEFLASLCRIIARRPKDELTYGFGVGRFDPVAGTYESNGRRRGLTCATFVLAVLSAYDNIVRLGAARAASDYELGVWLAAAHRLETWKPLGIASFGEYADTFLGIGRRLARERLRVALALEGLPVMAAALRDGGIHWSTARELTRVATETNEQAWLRAAEQKSSRGIENLVSCHQPGDDPSSPPTPPASVRVSFEVSPSTKALLAETRERMIKRVRRERVG